MTQPDRLAHRAKQEKNRGAFQGVPRKLPLSLSLGSFRNREGDRNSSHQHKRRPDAVIESQALPDRMVEFIVEQIQGRISSNSVE